MRIREKNLKSNLVLVVFPVLKISNLCPDANILSLGRGGGWLLGKEVDVTLV